MQVGEPGPGVDSNSMTHFSRTTKFSFKENGVEAFVEDGYWNKRIGVVDSDTGEFFRYCRAYRNRPDDGDPRGLNRSAAPAQQFRGPVYCAEPPMTVSPMSATGPPTGSGSSPCRGLSSRRSSSSPGRSAPARPRR